MSGFILIKKMKVKNIIIGNKARIKDSCTKYDKKYNGETGIIKKIYLKDYDLYADVYISSDNQHNKNSEYGYFCFHVGDFDVIANEDGTSETLINYSEVGYNFREYQQKLLKMATQSNVFVLDYNIENIIDNKGAEKMRSEKIINLWRNNQKNTILDNIAQKRNEILNADPLYSSIKKHVDEINKILMEQGFTKISDEILLKGHVVNTTNTLLSQNKALEFTLQKALDEQCNEICAMLSACVTYEQEMEVLKTYNIVGEDGKLVVVDNKMQY